MGLVTTLCLMLGASASTQLETEDAELADLLEVLEEETEVATKTRLNSDFVPGLVTVLQGDQLEAMGVRTVWEALAQVPGVETSLDDRGSPTVTVRGIPFPFNSGSVQILLNAIPTGREAAGVNSSAFFLPIAQVERIEFIRGPGSVLYGDFAFQGLVNIITRHSGRRLDLEIDSADSRSAHLLWSGGRDDWTYTLDFSGFNSDEAALPDAHPGQEERYSALLGLATGGLSLQANLFGRDLDSPVQNGTGGFFNERSLAVELRHETEWSEQVSTRSRLQYLDSDLRKPLIDFVADQFEVGADLFYRGWSGHELLVGVEVLSANLERGRLNPGASALLPPIPLSEVLDQDRRNHALFVQDQISLGERLTLTAGLRYDDVDRIGSRLTPRLSAVWQLDERHIVKAQIAEGFRGPTFFELDGADPARDLDFEVNRTSELTYIYRQPDLSLRATVFTSRIDDMVFLIFPSLQFGNVASARSHGFELEWTQRFSPQLRLDAHLSLARSEDTRNPIGAELDVPSTPDLLGHLGLLYSPSTKDLVSLRFGHVGNRDSAEGYEQLHLSYTRQQFLSPNLDLRLGIQNVGKQQVDYLFPGPLGDVPLGFRERVGWLQLSWRY